MNIYDKPPLTFEQQIKLLKDRGLIIADEKTAKEKLESISYYRLSAYMLPFKKNIGGNLSDDFRFGTTWEDIYNLYKFDRKLRLLLFDAIEKIEVAVRCRLVYSLSHKYGSHWQDDPSLFKEPYTKILSDGSTRIVDTFSDIQLHIKDRLENNEAEVFIKHYKSHYDTPSNPPSWMCFEVMYFNHLSRICSSLKNRSDLTEISYFFGWLPPKTFNSWLHTINYVRNLCAHHARLWNRDFDIVPEKFERSKNLIWISNPDTVRRGKIYYFLCIVNYLLQTINPNSSFKSRLKALLMEYRPKIAAMGFPEKWEKEDMWR